MDSRDIDAILSEILSTCTLHIHQSPCLGRVNLPADNMFRQLDKSRTKERLDTGAHFGDEHETRVEAQQSAAAEAFAVREEQRALGGVQKAHAAWQRELAAPVRAARLGVQRAHAAARTRRGQQRGQTRRVRDAAWNPTAHENETLDVSMRHRGQYE